MGASFVTEFLSRILGPPALRRPTARVAAAIIRQDRDSEVLICWAQLAGMFFFTLLYAIRPWDGPSRPVAIALAAYAAFTAFRLAKAHRGSLGRTLLLLSIAADIALLMITIATDSGGRAGSAFINSPSLYYVFIIIALRALRFDARWVILTGLAAASGWVVIWFLAAGPGAEARPMALIGTELDKLVSILMMTVVLALAVMRARRLLVHAVEGGTAVGELSRFFSPEVVETIIAAEAAIRPGEGVQREAAVLFIDLRGFTRMARGMEPRALVALLGEYQHAVGEVVRRHRGSIVTYLGDGIMVTFGASRVSASFAADAVAATEELIDILGRWSDERRARGLPGPRAGIGVAAGTVIFGAVGDEQRLEYATIGDPVNTAAKLQAHTKTEGVHALVTQKAWVTALAQGFVPRHQSTPRPACAVHGIADPIDVVAFE